MPLPAVAVGIAKVGAIIGKGAMAAGKGIAAGAKAGAKIGSSVARSGAKIGSSALKTGSRTVKGSAKSAKNLKISVRKIRNVLNKKNKRLSNLKKINVRDQFKLISQQKKRLAAKKLKSPLSALLAPLGGIAKIGSKIFDAFKFLLLGIGFTALWENASKIAEVLSNFYKRLVSWWDNSENRQLRKNIADEFEKIDMDKLVKQFKQLKELSDELRVKLAPIFEKDNVLLNKKGEINPKTFIEDEDNPGETLRFGETFDDGDTPLIGPTDDQERIDTYYVDQNGHVRLKEDNSRPWGSRFINKEGLERKDYTPISSIKKDDKISLLNSNGSKKNKVIIVKQPIIYT